MKEIFHIKMRCSSPDDLIFENDVLDVILKESGKCIQLVVTGNEDSFMSKHFNRTERQEAKKLYKKVQALNVLSIKQLEALGIERIN